MLITFSGLDGSGKSTLVDRVKQTLESENQNVAVSHMNYDVGLYSVLRFVRQKLSGNHQNETHAPRTRAYENQFESNKAKLRYNLVWNKSLRAMIYPIDVLIFVVYRLYVEKVKRQVLIMDRYFYDTLVDVTGARQSMRLSFLRFLTPTPTLPVYLDITPEQAFARKNEFSVDYLSKRRLSYQKLISALPGVLVVSTDHDLDTTCLNLTTAIRERLLAH